MWNKADILNYFPKLEFAKCSKYVKRKDRNNMKAKKFANKFGVSVEEM